MSNFEIKTIPLELVEIAPIYSLWDLSKKAGADLGKMIFEYYKNSDPTVFDKGLTKKNFYDTRKWYYYYKLETILTLSRIWYQKQEWQVAVIIEKSYRDPRGKQQYVVHDGTHRFSVMKSYKVEQYDFLLVNDRKSVTINDIDTIKKFYKPEFTDPIAIYPNPVDGIPMIQPPSFTLPKERYYPMVEQWISSKLGFWEFVRS